MEPLIAEVIIIAMILAIGGTLIMWYSGMIGSQQEKAGSQAEIFIDCSLADSSFYDVRFVNGTATIVLRNAGYSDDVISDASVYDNNLNKAASITSFPVDLPRGSMRTIDLNLRGITCANFNYAEVVTKCRTYRFTDVPKGC